MNTRRWLALLIGLACSLSSAMVSANPPLPSSPSIGGHRHQVAPAEPTINREEANRRYFTDRLLVNQDGQAMRFYSDLLKDKVVLIQFLYTQCQEACPLTTKQLADTQKLLDGRLGKDIVFLSLTVDPETDTPQRLKDYSQRFKAGKGWWFLTGTKQDVDGVAHQLGQTAPVAEGHLPIFILGNVRTGHWIKMMPSSTPPLIAEQLLKLADEKG